MSDVLLQAFVALSAFALGMLVCEMLRRPSSEAREALDKAMFSAVSKTARAVERLALRTAALEERAGIRPEGGEGVGSGPRTPGNPCGREERP